MKKHLPRNQELWFEGQSMKYLRKYNPGTLQDGRDIWDLFREVKELLWAYYSTNIERGMDMQEAFEEASQMAWVHSVYRVMCDDCSHNFQTINKADEYFLYSVEPYESIHRNWEDKDE